MPTRSPTLHLVQALAVCVLLRSEAGAAQALRVITEICEQEEAIRCVRQLEKSLDPQQRFWLGSVLGPRVRLQQAEVVT
jgi:hypothetical protein